jgi:hypothetical protein
LEAATEPLNLMFLLQASTDAARSQNQELACRCISLIIKEELSQTNVAIISDKVA